MFIWIGVALHLAYTKADLMLGHLKNSSSVVSIASLRHDGPWGKLLLVGGVSGFVTFSGFYIKRGGLSVEDINSFPAPLKRKLVVLQWSVIGLFAALALFVAVGKSGILK
jgi:hypothetical protein